MGRTPRLFCCRFICLHLPPQLSQHLLWPFLSLRSKNSIYIQANRREEGIGLFHYVLFTREIQVYRLYSVHIIYQTSLWTNKNHGQTLPVVLSSAHQFFLLFILPQRESSKLLPVLLVERPRNFFFYMYINLYTLSKQAFA